MVSSKQSLFLGFLLCLLGVFDGRFVADAQESPCDFGPDALTDMYGKSIPRTCIDVPHEDDGSTTTALRRCYYTYVPDSCYELAGKIEDNDEAPLPMKLPLVFDIHGAGSCPLGSTFYTGWMAMADKECFVLVWPSGNNADEGDFLFNCFNLPGFLEIDDYGEIDGNIVTPAPCCCRVPGAEYDGMDTTNVTSIMASTEPNDSLEPNDPLFLKMAIDSVVESFITTNTSTNTNEEEPLFSIDRNRVYMAGHSNGCMTSLAMAALYSDTIAAVCCHAGALITPFPLDYTPVPIWMAHGMKDDTIPYNGSFYVDDPQLRKLGFLSIDQTMEYLSNQNGCTKETEMDLETNETGIIGKLYQRKGCKNNANVEIVALTNTIHMPYQVPLEFGLMMGANPETFAPIDTTALAWEFCSSFVKNLAGDDKPAMDLVEEMDANVTGTGDGKETNMAKDLSDANSSSGSPPQYSSDAKGPVKSRYDVMNQLLKVSALLSLSWAGQHFL